MAVVCQYPFFCLTVWPRTSSAAPVCPASPPAEVLKLLPWAMMWFVSWVILNTDPSSSQTDYPQVLVLEGNFEFSKS